MVARNLSTGDVCQVAGMTMKRLRILIDERIIEPVEGGGGKGQHRLFALNQAVALTFFCKLVDTGMAGHAMARVPEYLVQFSERQLLSEFKAGRTHLIVAPDTVRLIRPPCDGLDSLNVEVTYREVVAAIATIEEELTQQDGRGRRRGLATGDTKR